MIRLRYETLFFKLSVLKVHPPICENKVDASWLEVRITFLFHTFFKDGEKKIFKKNSFFKIYSSDNIKSVDPNELSMKKQSPQWRARTQDLS